MGAARPVVHLPESLEETLELLETYGDQAKLIAGGTALMIMLKAGLVEPERLISLTKLRGRIRKIERIDGRVQVGALVSLREVERSQKLREALPLLGSATGLVANVRVRNLATVGGNLSEADYASDPPCVLLALGARVEILSRDGVRWVELEDFLRDYYETCLEPHELVASVEADERPRASGRYLKFITRSSEDRPCLGVAALFEADDEGRCSELRVAVGAATSVPFRVPDAERLAVGEHVTDQLLGEIGDLYAAHAKPLSDLRGSREYRRELIRALVRRAIREAADGRRGAVKL